MKTHKNGPGDIVPGWGFMSANTYASKRRFGVKLS